MKQKELNKRFFKALEGDYIKVKRLLHDGYDETIKDKVKIPKGKTPNYFGKYNYIFSSPKGKISLIKIKKDLWYKGYVWEIFCLYGELFKDAQRFLTKKQAEVVIRKYLND